MGLPKERINRRGNLDWRGGENEGQKEGDAWGQPSAASQQIQSGTCGRKAKSPRQNIDEEKQIKIRANLRPSIEN